MVSAFSQFIEERNLCNPNHKILVAVSGGIDSIVMLDLFDKAGYNISIAHYNFKLRGQESDKDELFVRNLAKKYKVKVFTKSFDAQAYAKDNKLSIQEAARNLRYNWFEKLVIDKGFDRIAVGQHLGDQIETFFINLFRGSGVKGLKGIPVKRGKIIRPLLFAQRDELEKYVKENHLRYREDSSNISDKYLRNRIRHHLLPVISELKSAFQDSLLKSLSFLEEENEMLVDLLNQKRDEIFLPGTEGLKAELKIIEKFSPAILYALLAEYGFNRDVSDALHFSLSNSISGKVFHSPSHHLLIDREFIYIKEVTETDKNEEFLVDENQTEIEEPIPLYLKKVKNSKSLEIVKEPEYAYFDFDKLTFPLKIRRWKTGDRFIPFGMKGSKLVSDFLIDEKVSRFDKENIWILLSGDQIIWVIGHRSSERNKIRPDTKNVIQLKLNLSTD